MMQHVECANTEGVSFAPVFRWKDHTQDFYPLTKENLIKLFDNEIPAIRIPSFATEEECNKFRRAILSKQLELVTESVKDGEVSIIELHDRSEFQFEYTGQVKRVGISQSEYSFECSEEYFGKVKEAYALQEEVAEKEQYFPLEKLIQMIQEVHPYPVGIAKRDIDQFKYFCGLVRFVGGGTYPHFDFAPFHAGEMWEIGRINAELSWNLFVTAPSGGETIVYDCPWVPEMEKLRKGLNEPYPPSVVEGVDLIKSVPIRGDIVIFNSRNFHEVLPSNIKQDLRLTFSSFIGRNDDNSIILWS